MNEPRESMEGAPLLCYFVSCDRVSFRQCTRHNSVVARKIQDGTEPGGKQCGL
jgi:hypothetical protein